MKSIRTVARAGLGVAAAMSMVAGAADMTAGVSRTLSHAITPIDRTLREEPTRRKDKAKRDRTRLHMRNYVANRRKRRTCKLGRHLAANRRRGLLGRA